MTAASVPPDYPALAPPFALQFMFLLLLLPLVAGARGIPPPALPAHLATGAGCFLGHAAVGGPPCHGAPLLPLVYITTNLVFNVAQLALLKATTAVVPSIALTLAGEGPLWLVHVTL